MSERNPYQAPVPVEHGAEPDAEGRSASRALAVIVALVARFPGVGLLMLGRTKLAVPWLAGGAAAWLTWILLPGAALAMVGLVLFLLLWLASVVVTLVAKRGRHRPGLPAWALASAIIGGTVGLAMATRVFVCEAFQMPAGSMIPALMVGDHIFVRKWQKTPARGDVIVFEYPQDTDIDYVKRVVALPGESIAVRGRQVIIDGRPLGYRHSGAPCPLGGTDCQVGEESTGPRSYHVLHDAAYATSDYGPVTVPPGSYFVLGDNRHNSNDSRVWGTVPGDHIKGVARMVWWSRDPASGTIRWERLGTPVR